MAKKMTKEDARNLLRNKGISFKANFYTLSAGYVGRGE